MKTTPNLTDEEKIHYFDEMYNLLDEWSKRSLWGNHDTNDTTGHLGICSIQFGPPEKCHVCGTTIKTINLLNEIDCGNNRNEEDICPIHKEIKAETDSRTIFLCPKCEENFP